MVSLATKQSTKKTPINFTTQTYNQVMQGKYRTWVSKDKHKKIDLKI